MEFEKPGRGGVALLSVASTSPKWKGKILSLTLYPQHGETTDTQRQLRSVDRVFSGVFCVSYRVDMENS